MSDTDAKTVQALLARVNALPIIQQRAISAMLGAVVADAAARPMHWVYNTEVIAQQLATGNNHGDLAFWPENVCPFYDLPTGESSCWQDPCWVTLHTLSPLNGSGQPVPIDADVFRAKMLTTFGEGSRYAEMRQWILDSKYNDTPWQQRAPLKGPYQHAAVTDYLAGGKGLNINKQDGFTLALPLIAQLASCATLEPEQRAGATAEHALRLCGHLASHRRSLTEAAILTTLIQCPAEDMTLNLRSAYPLDVLRTVAASVTPTLVGDTTAEAETVLNEIKAVFEAAAAGEDYVAAVKRWGQSCSNPGVLQGGLMAVLTGTSFADAIRLCIAGGGDCCGRSIFAGAALGALVGINGIPSDWILKTKRGVACLELCLQKFVPPA